MAVMLLPLLMLGTATASSGDCTQLNKEKALYAYPEFDPPLSDQAAFDIIADVRWVNLDDMRAFGKNGIYAGFPVKWAGKDVPGGYFGPQATGHGDPEKQQVLFSLWDAARGTNNWHPALPRSPQCKRNCNDCKHDETTGTQCKTFIPAHSGQTLRLRIRQTATNVTDAYNGTQWTGDEWEVTVMNTATGVESLVGRQLLVNALGNGIHKIDTFHEHIGCTPCGSFDEAEERSGPWVLKPPGTRLKTVSSKYSCDQCTCRDHTIVAVNGTAPTWRFVSGPSIGDHADWDKTVLSCDDGVHDCDRKPVTGIIV